MKRLWVALLFLGVALVLFIGAAAWAKSPLDGLQESLVGMQDDLSGKIDGLQESIWNFQWTLLNGRFTDNGDGTVRDKLTGLVWTEDANLGPMDWESACAECENLVVDPYDDWRLPNVRELQSLVDYGAYNPALPSGHPFVGVRVYYWSSATDASSSATRAWIVNFGDGRVYHGDKSNVLYVWCVRGGK